MTYLSGQRVTVLGEGRVRPDGVAHAVLVPALSRRWTLARVTLHSDSEAQTTAHLYRGFPDPGNLLEETIVGNADSTARTIALGAGESLTVVWRGGTVGARCVARAEGAWD